MRVICTDDGPHVSVGTLSMWIATRHEWLDTVSVKLHDYASRLAWRGSWGGLLVRGMEEQGVLVWLGLSAPLCGVP